MKYLIISILAVAAIGAIVCSCGRNNSKNNNSHPDSSKIASDSAAAAKDSITLMPPMEFIKTLKADSLGVILDVRKPDEFEAGHIARCKTS